MADPGFTCVPIDKAKSNADGVDLWLGIAGLFGVFLSTIVLMAGTSPPPLSPLALQLWALALMASCLMTINLIDKIQLVLLHRRLACIDGERCAVGQVVRMRIDQEDGICLAMKLAPIQETTTVEEFRNSFPGQSLVYSDPGAATRGWEFRPEANVGVVSGKQPIPLFSCVVPSAAYYDWLANMVVLLWTLFGLAVVVLVFATSPLFWVGWVLFAIILLFILLCALFAADTGTGEPGDVSPDVPVGEQLPGPNGPVLTDTGNNQIVLGDFVMLTGLHVLDCGHADSSGTWCALFPVRAIAKVDRAFYDDFSKGANQQLADRYCLGLQTAAATDGPVATKQQPLEHPTIG